MSFDTLRTITLELADAVDALRFAAPVATVYNPLRYAAARHFEYLERYGSGQRAVLLIGMNPGPWGMAQTGVPFGAVPAVRDFLGIDGPVQSPPVEHPKKRVEGFACKRVEVSGARLWGWAEQRYGDAARFFERFFVINYCPLLFLDGGGRNLTPDKLRVDEREPLTAACDRALQRFAAYYRPQIVIGVGAFAEQRAGQALGGMGLRVGRILHPSPASPQANRGWTEAAAQQLRALGVE